jgi:hypothetical protein
VNRQPVAPYLQVGHILNPWGWPAHRLSIRLPLKALVELSVIGVPPGVTGITRLGGRVFGRYWFSAT